MNDTRKKTLAIIFFIVGVVLSIFSISLCVIRYRMDSFSLLFDNRGIFLFFSLLILVAGFYLYPTQKHRSIINVLFLLPVLIPFAMTVVIPFILGVFFSFTDWNGVKFSNFVNFENYAGVFTDKTYVYSILLTIVFAIINVLLINVLGFLLSLLVTQKINGANIYRAGFFVPNLIGGIVLGYVWQFIFNYMFTNIGSVIGISVMAKSMLSGPYSALAAIIIVSTWQYAGYIMMIYVTALQGIPSSVIEASVIDGASGWRRMLSIIIPMCAQAFTICLFLTLVNSFKQFDLNLTLTNGGPALLKETIGGRLYATNSTELQALNIYKTAIVKNKWALGQAKAVIFFVLLAIVSLVQVTVNKKREEEL
ncbi:MAG: ABC transporter permease [Treponema sp. CETP13]|nr:MAG: ABC transporter permease [Treponema sp. CETP13]